LARRLEIDQDANEPKVGIILDANNQNIILNDSQAVKRIRIGSRRGPATGMLETNLGVMLKNSAGKEVVSIGSKTLSTNFGTTISGGSLSLNNKDGNNTIYIDGDKGDISVKKGGTFLIQNNVGHETISLDANSGVNKDSGNLSMEMERRSFGSIRTAMCISKGMMEFLPLTSSQTLSIKILLDCGLGQ
jgi:hypothetical protein